MGAWIEIEIDLLNAQADESHPTWVRGLKSYGAPEPRSLLPESHPTWVRGLKFLAIAGIWGVNQGRTPRGCVD